MLFFPKVPLILWIGYKQSTRCGRVHFEHSHVVTDLAGNVTDTDSEEFKEACAYEFNDVVTISTNPMVRAMAWIKDHAKVIAGTVAVVAATVAGIIVLVLVRRRKDSEDDSESGGDNSEEK